MPKAKAGTHRALTQEERAVFDILFKAHKRGCWAEFMLMFGSRPAETKRIYGRHIDIDKRRVYIDGTKSQASKRWLPMRDDMRDRFRAFLADAAGEPFRPLFRKRDGGTIRQATRRRWWKFLKAAYEKESNRDAPDHANRPFPADLVPYCFRHAYATDLKGFGVPPERQKPLRIVDFPTFATVFHVLGFPNTVRLYPGMIIPAHQRQSTLESQTCECLRRPVQSSRSSTRILRPEVTYTQIHRDRKQSGKV
ncbi:MAG: tyrosine-type recombinase/integrase [Clostridiales Family XIII bacterium]|jgi:integrase|nr:tyrosine-type recombinase/integrase [Clostridiales Family XIII bacterium]